MLAGPVLYGPAAGHHVVAVLGSVIGNVGERGLLLTFPCLEALLQAAPAEAAAALQPVLLRMLALVLGGKESGLVVSNALPVLGRLLLAAPAQFVALCAAGAADGEVAAAVAAGREGIPTELSPAEAVLWRLLSLWCEQFDSLGQAGARRLCALALAAGLGLPSRALLGLLDQLLPAITAVWYETEGGGGGFSGEGMPPSYDYFAGGGLHGCGEEGLMEEVAGPALDSEEADGECGRRAQLREADPAGSLPVSEALRRGLAAAAALHGPQQLDAALSRLDEAVAHSVRAATAVPGQAAGQAGG
ncbi:hypothetical protein GPECTOR_6g495 [Gonium pectorale]|uniref:Importin-7/11-like TPR repeats domain-containing protein n=1 Tax=Gonium pectorale TaxID=33097 RepID=A0A150GV64_GONPE|nr:hypothetical protein GPECTOR_6g495 [Gonium pectorale]|eukprot:KXZ53578.1 hypothetical protein GPECTOR_6g495 [Gonium pectorale]